MGGCIVPFAGEHMCNGVVVVIDKVWWFVCQLVCRQVPHGCCVVVVDVVVVAAVVVVAVVVVAVVIVAVVAVVAVVFW